MISFERRKVLLSFSCLEAFQRLIEECRKRKIVVCIDGAHAPGQIDLNLEELAPDFYAGNLHKWAYVKG